MTQSDFLSLYWDKALLQYADDSFGNLLASVGIWYHENPEAILPSDRHIRGNVQGANYFYHGCPDSDYKGLEESVREYFLQWCERRRL